MREPLRHEWQRQNGCVHPPKILSKNRTVIPFQPIALHTRFADMLSLIFSMPTSFVHTSVLSDLQIFEPLQKYPLVSRICSVLFGVSGNFSVQACQYRPKHMVLKKNDIVWSWEIRYTMNFNAKVGTFSPFGKFPQFMAKRHPSLHKRYSQFRWNSHINRMACSSH